jgi:hypothetical protein
MLLRLFMCGCVVVCFAFSSAAQFPYYQYFQDTLRPGYRISGAFDSIDVKLGSYQSTQPTLWRPSQEVFDLSRMYTAVPTQLLPLRFSSIPHVGLQYSFGSNASQQGGLSYTQALTPNQFIQLDYKRQNSNGAIRNATFEYNHFELAHLVRLSRYASQVRLLFDGVNKGTGGGIFNDSIDDSQPIEFFAVEKSVASIRTRNFVFDWQNYFSFTKDSLIKTGLYLAPHYEIRNRRYTEEGDIVAIYGTANINPDETNDYWERTEIGGTAGYFFHTRAFSINGGLKTKYWDFDNLSVKSDTIEAGLVSDVVVQLRSSLQLTANGSYTFVGAAGEKTLNANLYFKPNFADFNVRFLFNELFPTNDQRAYFSNTLNYSWQSKTLVTTTGLEATVKSKINKLPLKAGFSFKNIQNAPFFSGTGWRQDTLTNLSFLSADLRADLSWWKLFLQPTVRVQQSNFSYVPTFQAFARFGFDGFLFKAKKLRATIGVDLGYTTAFNLLDYAPQVDAYVLPSGTSLVTQYTAMPKLHAFTQFELGFFRWYIRVENIEQALIKTTNQETLGYPVVPLQLRIGLSWDLFN